MGTAGELYNIMYVLSGADVRTLTIKIEKIPFRIMGDLVLR